MQNIEFELVQFLLCPKFYTKYPVQQINCRVNSFSHVIAD